MINYSAEINIIDTDGEVSAVNVNAPENNVSSGVSISNNDIDQGKKIFLLGDDTNDGTPLNGEYSYTDADGYPGFMSTGLATGTLTVVITTNTTTEVAHFYFDRYFNQYPQTITYNGETYENAEPIFSLALDMTQTSHTVTMSNWTHPERPYMVCTINAALRMIFDRSNLMTFNFTRSEIADNEQLSYGIVANTGEMTVKDKNAKLRLLASQNLLLPDQDIKIYLESTDSESKAAIKDTIATMHSERWSYNSTEYQATISLYDPIQELQNRTFSINLSTNATNLYNIFALLEDETTALGFTIILESEAEDILRDTSISYWYIDECSLWDAWNKLANLAQLHIFTNEIGSIIVRYYGI